MAKLADQLLAAGLILGRRAVGYARISDDAEEQLSSLNNQIEYFDEYFDESGLKMVKECGMYHKRDGTKQVLAGIYADEGISGLSLRRRVAFKKMLEDAKKKLFDVIVVKSIQRFARDVENGYPIIKDLAQLGVAVYFLDNDLSSLKPDSDKEIIDGLNNAQTESRIKSKNVQFGVRRSQKRGRWTGSPMYGYEKVNGMLERNEFELSVMKEIAHLFYTESLGGKRIKTYLEEKEILTKTGKEKWDVEAILKLISNPIYTGLQVQHTVKTVDVNRNIKVKVDSKDWVMTYRPELAIFTFEYWNLLQVERQRRSGKADYLQIYEDDGEPRLKVVKSPKESIKTKQRHSSKHIFSNLIYCGNCGRAHRRQKRGTKKPRFRWSCSTYQNLGLKACKHSNNVFEDDLLEKIKTELIDFRNDKASRNWYLEAFLKLNFKEVDQARLIELDETHQLVTKRMNDTLDNLSDGILSRNLLEKRLETLQAELEALEEEQRTIRYRDEGIEMVRRKFEEFMTFLESVDPDDLQNGVLRRIIDRIVVSTDEVKKKRGEDFIRIIIHWKFLDKTTEDELFWEHQTIEHQEWERNVWYKGMTDEEIQAAKEEEALRREWELSPEGQQYMQEQEELAQEIFEHELEMEKKARS